MTKASVRQLSDEFGAPAITLLCPLDQRQPGNAHDAAMLRQLRDEAVKAIGATAHDNAADVIARLDDALASVDAQHPSAGLAIFVSPDVSQVISLRTPVEARVVVGDRFAVRDAVAAERTNARVRVLVLSQHQTRCVDLTGDASIERTDHGFPVAVMPPTEADTPHRDFPLDEHERAEAIKFVFRAVDGALGSLEQDDNRPLVLFGTERDLAYFEEVAGRGRDVIGRVHGSRDTATVSEIARLARPIIERHDSEIQRRACDDAREAIGAGAVSGIVEVWQAARAGRGECLVVESDYRYPADEPSAADAVEDTIREVIRHGGDVVLVGSGALSDLDHIALLTRY